MKPTYTSFILVLTTMWLSVCIAPSACADRAENAFVIVEGDGVVRIDGKNFAVLSNGTDTETIVTIAPQPGWQLLSPSSVKVRAGSPIPFQARSKSLEEIVNGIVTTIRIELTAYGCCLYNNGEEGAWDDTAEIPVPEDKEENPGAFIHWNIDNDNNSTGGTTKHPGGDYLEHTEVSGENDLKKLSCSLWADNKSEVTAGFAILELNSASAAIWKSRQKGPSDMVVQPGSSKKWNLSDSSERSDFYSLKDHLYIEGINSGSCDIEFRFELNGKSISDRVRYTFISANCGRQPSVAERNYLAGLFPNLTSCEWSITGEATPDYNCIAWACGITDIFLDKKYVDQSGNSIGEIVSCTGIKYRFLDGYYGDKDGEFSTNDVILCFQKTKGLSPTASGPADAVVMYYDGYHAAIKKGCSCGDGKWIMFESKLGRAVRIEHISDQLDGELYGKPIIFFK